MNDNILGQSQEETIIELKKQVLQLKEVDEKLRNSEMLLKEAERLAQLGHWEFDVPTGGLIWSDEIYRIFNLDPASFIPSYETFLDAIHPDDREMVATAYAHSIKNKTPYCIVHRLKLPRGEVKYVQEVCETTYGSNGEPLVSFGTVQDVSEKILHDELVQQTNRLDSIGLLASGIAHDFNSSLAGIVDNLDTVLGNLESSDKNFELLEKAQNSAMKAQSFTRQLSTFGRADRPKCEPADLAEIAQETVKLFSSGTGTTVEWDLPESLWTVNVDLQQIKFVFQNLTVNAIEAMSKGGVLKISMVNRRAGDSAIFKNAGITIRFQDSGPGIGDDDANSIFDPYFSTKEFGKGLGLAVVESIISKHGGQIYLDRESGHQSLFMINIPVSSQETGIL